MMGIADQCGHLELIRLELDLGESSHSHLLGILLNVKYWYLSKHQINTSHRNKLNKLLLLTMSIKTLALICLNHIDKSLMAVFSKFSDLRNAILKDPNFAL